MNTNIFEIEKCLVLIITIKSIKRNSIPNMAKRNSVKIFGLYTFTFLYTSPYLHLSLILLKNILKMCMKKSNLRFHY